MSALQEALLKSLSNVAGQPLTYAQRVLYDNPPRALLCASTSAHEVLDGLKSSMNVLMLRNRANLRRAIDASKKQRNQQIEAFKNDKIDAEFGYIYDYIGDGDGDGKLG